MEPAKLTYGEKCVGLTFNHAEGKTHDTVHELKVLAAKQIDILDAERKTVTNPSEKGAILTHGIRVLMDSQSSRQRSNTYQFRHFYPKT